jgi:hypothetical protein
MSYTPKGKKLDVVYTTQKKVRCHTIKEKKLDVVYTTQKKVRCRIPKLRTYWTKKLEHVCTVSPNVQFYVCVV